MYAIAYLRIHKNTKQYIEHRLINQYHRGACQWLVNYLAPNDENPRLSMLSNLFPLHHPISLE